LITSKDEKEGPIKKGPSVEGSPSNTKHQSVEFALGRYRNLPRASLVVGTGLLMVTNLVYVAFYPTFYSANSSTIAVVVSLATLLSASAFFALAGISFLSIPPGRARNSVTTTAIISTKGIISDAFFHNRLVVALAAIAYAVFFGFLDGIIIYQPQVDFARAYLASGILSTGVLQCCGPPGDVPVGLVFFPTIHAGLQLIPLSVLLMILISVLVGLNFSLIFKATSLSRSPRRSVIANQKRSGRASGYLGAFAGAASGLFAGCPSCAGAFFLSMVAGSGATAFSFYIAQYQSLIALLTVPLLLASIHWQARNIRKVITKGCPL
jgi:hypothetical protein